MSDKVGTILSELKSALDSAMEAAEFAQQKTEEENDRRKMRYSAENDAIAKWNEVYNILVRIHANYRNTPGFRDSFLIKLFDAKQRPFANTSVNDGETQNE